MYTIELIVQLSREVRVDDALAIVQSQHWSRQQRMESTDSVSSTTVDRRNATSITMSKTHYPIFRLYSKRRDEDMQAMIQEGIRLTLENDPEQRILVERQRSSLSGTNSSTNSLQKSSIGHHSSIVKRASFLHAFPLASKPAEE